MLVRKKAKKRRHSIFKETYISFLEKYEKRNGAEMLTMPQFFCFYREESQVEECLLESESTTDSNDELQQRPFYDGYLPKIVKSVKTKYVLRKKECFWRTFNESEFNGERYYYQQIVTKKPIFNNTFEELKGPYRSWRGKKHRNCTMNLLVKAKQYYELYRLF